MHSDRTLSFRQVVYVQATLVSEAMAMGYRADIRLETIISGSRVK